MNLYIRDLISHFMGKQQFHFNAVTNRFEVVKPSLRFRLLRYGLPALIALTLSFGIRYSLEHHISNPKEIKLLAEKEILVDQYQAVENRILELEASLQEFQHWDDNIYRAYYEMEPIPTSLRDAGHGGAEQYLNLQGYESSSLMVGLTQRVDMVGMWLDIQSGSFNALLSEAEYHKLLIDHKPSIQPISLNDFYWVSSLYGYRIDPMSKRRTMHRGVDFAGRIGLNVYATGDGVVIRTKIARTGFGKEILIDHGFGFVTRYGHLNSIDVKVGQEVKRGFVIGKLGHTGKSTGPHLHYEVREYGRAKNPKHYYSEDLTPNEYQEIVSLSGSNSN